MCEKHAILHVGTLEFENDEVHNSKGSIQTLHTFSVLHRNFVDMCRDLSVRDDLES